MTEFPDASEESLLRVSISMHEGLKVLVRDGAGSHVIYAMGLLICHSLETCLKAYLMQNQAKKVDVRKFNHNLLKLWDAASKAGLDIGKAQPDWVKHIAPYHNHPYHLRYPPHQHGMPIHDPKIIENELGKIIDKVKSSSRKTGAGTPENHKNQ